MVSEDVQPQPKFVSACSTDPSAVAVAASTSRRNEWEGMTNVEATMDGLRPSSEVERTNWKAQWPIGYGVGLQIKRSSVRIRPGGGRCVESLDKGLYSHCPKEKPSH